MSAKEEKMVYQPNVAIHPGKTVQRTLDDLGMTQKKLAERTGLTEKHISQIINGEASLTADTALLLENALGGSASFWLNLDKNYRETKARIEQEEKAAAEISLLTNFPYKDLVRVGQVVETRNLPERVKELWRFFGVNSLRSIQQTQAVAYRRKESANVRRESLAAWLRYGEIKSGSLRLKEFNESKLKSLFPAIKQITRNLDDNFFEKLQNLLAEAGVGLVAVHNFQGTQVHGATRWIGNNPLVQLSARGRNADGIWFTLFHELGHVLLHGKKQEFIEFTKAEKTNEEQEADIFARRSLIADSDYRDFLIRGDFSETAIMKFADSLLIDPGIVLGRLQMEGYVHFSQMPHLHQKLEVMEVI